MTKQGISAKKVSYTKWLILKSWKWMITIAVALGYGILVVYLFNHFNSWGLLSLLPLIIFVLIAIYAGSKEQYEKETKSNE